MVSSVFVKAGQYVVTVKMFTKTSLFVVSFTVLFLGFVSVSSADFCSFGHHCPSPKHCCGEGCCYDTGSVEFNIEYLMNFIPYIVGIMFLTMFILFFWVLCHQLCCLQDQIRGFQVTVNDSRRPVQQHPAQQPSPPHLMDPAFQPTGMHFQQVQLHPHHPGAPPPYSSAYPKAPTSRLQV